MRSIKSLEILSSLLRVTSLRRLNENWDGNGAIRPKEVSTKTTLSFLSEIFRMAELNGLKWIHPLINVSVGGDFVCEWLNIDKKLTINISESEVYFTKIENIDTNPAIHTGLFLNLSINEKYDLIRWIFINKGD